MLTDDRLGDLVLRLRRLGWALGASYDSVDQATHVVEGALVLGIIVFGFVLLRRRIAAKVDA